MSLLTSALDLAAGGWKVLPCVPTGPHAKAPLIPTGFKAASSDPGTIRDWWTAREDALIGVAVPEHVLILDVDPRNGGSVDALEEVLGPLPETLTSHSGRGDGGRHFWFRRPAGQLTGRKLPTGVDLKDGGRGYVIVPPSLHPLTGEPYRWEAHPIAELPQAARAALRDTPRPVVVPASRGRASMRGGGLVRFVADAVEGERNSRVFWAACRALEDGRDDLVQEIFDAALSVGLSDREAAQTIASAQRTIGGAA